MPNPSTKLRKQGRGLCGRRTRVEYGGMEFALVVHARPDGTYSYDIGPWTERRLRIVPAAPINDVRNGRIKQ